MSSPSKVHPSHAAIPERHCCLESCRTCVTSPATAGAVMAGADTLTFVTSMLIQNQLARIAPERESKSAPNQRRAHLAVAPSERIGPECSRPQPQQLPP